MKVVLWCRTRRRSVRRLCHTTKAVQVRGENMNKKAEEQLAQQQSPKSEQGTGEPEVQQRVEGRPQQGTRQGGMARQGLAMKGLQSP